VIVSATPGQLYRLGAINIAAQPTVPPDLIRKALPLNTGEPIDAAKVEGAEANVSLTLPQNGYPFAKLGTRDIVLDDETYTGDYTLPVDTGARSSFGAFRLRGKKPVFDAKHIGVLARFKRGDLYDERKTDDLRKALVATGLFSSVSVRPVKTGEAGPDGTQYADMQVRQVAGPTRTLAATAGYSTGEGFKLEGSWTSRNLFPPEGALILNAIAGSQQQGAGATFRRSNAGKRDRTFSAGVTANHNNYDAYDAFTGTLFARWAYDSTPLWQKKLTYAYGVELIGTNESVYDFAKGARERRTYGILTLPGQVVFDQSDDLLNPTKGYRLKLNLSPETSVHGALRPYARTMVEATGYYPVRDDLVLAGRVRAGSIFGIDRDDLAPSRRYYGGGGGSVRGYGYQRLGPFDPNGDPLGGRSINEFSIEARYRFGDYGIVPFFDGGNAYASTFPQFDHLHFGAGIGGRLYTNFGPIRIDIATPLNPRKGDGRIALYISIGQAF
jgi:translocation and assembly module TamA